MRHRSRRVAPDDCAALLFCCLLALRPETASATAAPNVIIVQGDLLAAPVVLDDWDENVDLMLTLGEPVDEPPWAVSDYLAAGVQPLQLLETEFRLPESHEMATLFLGTDTEPAVFWYKGYHVVEGRAEEILASRGVPLTAAIGADSRPPVYRLAGVVAAVIVMGLLGARRWRRES